MEETGIVALEEDTGDRGGRVMSGKGGGDGARGGDGGRDPAACIARRESMRARSRLKAI